MKGRTVGRGFVAGASLALLGACSTLRVETDGGGDAACLTCGSDGAIDVRSDAPPAATDARRDAPVIGPAGDSGADVPPAVDVVAPPPDVPASGPDVVAADVPDDADNCPADLPPPPTGEPACPGPCQDHAHCLGGSCQCDPGFDSSGAGCTPQGVSDPASHSDSEMCARWAAGHVEDATDGFVPGSACNCDPGTMTRVQRNDMLRRLNMFRWFVGLGPVSDDEDTDRNEQFCAIMESMHGPGSDPHHPTMDWPCYTATGSGGAGSSNLAWGPRTAAQSVDGFMDDGGNAGTMGHRRWFLHPPLGPIGVGQYAGATCVEVFLGGGGGPQPDWWAYPPPGAYLRWKFTGEWTFMTARYGITDQTDFVVTRAADGSPVDGTVYHLPYGYGDSAIGFDPRAVPNAGETFHITIDNLMVYDGTGSTTSISYDIHGVDCP